MTYPIVDLTFWNPGDPGAPEIDALLADPSTPLAKHGLTGIASAYAEETGAFMHDAHRWWANEMAMKSLAVDGALTEVVPALREAGIPFFVAKGPARSVQTDNARLCCYTDLDIYVSECDLVRARDALLARGYVPVAQARGVLGGRARELHGGSYGATVEVHESIVDNSVGRHVAPTSAFFPFVHDVEVAGIGLPVLSLSAAAVVEAIHLACGHRFAKLVLFRELGQLLPYEDASVNRALDGHQILGRCRAALDGLTCTAQPSTRRVNVLLRWLGSTDPRTWDEHAFTVRNVVALLASLPTPRTGAVVARHIVGAPLLPGERRARLRGATPGSRSSRLSQARH